MNPGAILFRFVLLVTVISTLVGCQQEPGPDLPTVIASRTATTAATKQRLPTMSATTSPTRPLNTPEPTSTDTPAAAETATIDAQEQEGTSLSIVSYDNGPPSSYPRISASNASD